MIAFALTCIIGLLCGAFMGYVIVSLFLYITEGEKVSEQFDKYIIEYIKNFFKNN